MGPVQITKTRTPYNSASAIAGSCLYRRRRCLAVCLRPRGPISRSDSIQSLVDAQQRSRLLEPVRDIPGAVRSRAALALTCHTPVDRLKIGVRRRFTLPRLLEVRCVFRRDSGSLTFDVPPSETSRWRAVARVLRSPMDALSCALLPCLLCSLRLPSAAAFFRANLRCLLDGISRPERPRRARAAATRSTRPMPDIDRSGALPGLPPGAAAVCARSGLRALPGPHEGGHSRAQVRPPAPGGARAGPDAGRGHRAAGGRGAGRDAGGSRAAAPRQSTRSAASTRRGRWPSRRWDFCARAIRNGGSRWPRAR